MENMTAKIPFFGNSVFRPRETCQGWYEKTLKKQLVQGLTPLCCKSLKTKKQDYGIRTIQPQTL